MKNYWKSAAGLVLAGPLLITACKKSDKGELSGPAPQPTFTVTTRQVGLTTEATFTNTTSYTGEGIVFYEWDFGDGSTTSATTPTVTHVYSKGGTIQAQLLASARGGNGFSEKKSIVLPDVITLVKQLLTGGSSKTWKLQSDTVNTITVGTEGNSSQYYAGGPANSLPGCQADDEYTFSNSNVFTYDAKAETYVAATTTTPVVPAHCDAPRSGTSDFTFGPPTGAGYAVIEFKKPGTFIAVTDAPDLTYRIISITAKRMVLRAGKSSGTVFDIKLAAK